MDIYLIRHTQTATDPGLCYGQSDVTLADSFEDETTDLHDKLPEFDEDCKVFSSPLTRCLQLAQTFAVLPTNSTVTIASGAVLQLAAASVTNKVAVLITNGVAAGNGLYGSANSSGYITGSGHLLVGTPGPSSPEPIHTSYNPSTGQLTLTWTPGLSWRLECQTNNLSTGLSPAGWSTVSGFSDGSAAVTIDPSKPTVFYRLVYP